MSTRKEDGTTYLLLYGAGICGAKPGAVWVVFNGVRSAPVFAGAQPFCPALDQLNAAIPASLAGGTVQV